MGKAAALLGNTTGLIGLLSLAVNQAGGKLSDSIGRKTSFLLGPSFNILVGLLLFNNPKNKNLIVILRVLRQVLTTFSNTVSVQAALQDLVSGKDLAIEGSKIGALVGLGIISAPILESKMLMRTNNSFKHPFLALSGVAALHAAYSAMVIPETLDVAKRRPMELSWATFNPFGFLRVFSEGSAVLKRIVTITTIQMCLEGKALSDLSQIWMRNNLNWDTNGIRNFLVLYGSAAALASGKLTPYLLKSMSALKFTTLTNLTNALGFFLRGCTTNSYIFLLATIPMLPGVNGNSAFALNALRADHAKAAGFGIGEFSAWTNNLRSLAAALAPWLYGQWYNMCQRLNIYPGTTYYLAAFLGAILPELLTRGLYDIDPKELTLKAPESEKAEQNPEDKAKKTSSTA
eukprot:TRINITY_DN14929_c0_g3_i1.p1 TRINITY_DN14929_c0_g3~~TRINITY_DN14929_c0_g3_i1.p1  ORF type:complete len:470 (-),score=67.69 TRINITY_DN14929_c0_g3_i1:138-1346(-)